jgi:hypothetical protein
MFSLFEIIHIDDEVELHSIGVVRAHDEDEARDIVRDTVKLKNVAVKEIRYCDWDVDSDSMWAWGLKWGQCASGPKFCQEILIYDPDLHDTLHGGYCYKCAAENYSNAMERAAYQDEEDREYREIERGKAEGRLYSIERSLYGDVVDQWEIEKSLRGLED